MFVPGVLFALFLAGCWLYCLTDAALLPAGEYAGWPKRAWIAVIAVTFIFGAAAWALMRRRARTRPWRPSAFDQLMLAGLGEVNVTWYPHPPLAGSAEAALARHPAGRSRMAGGRAPRGPDDDPEFLRQLARRIQDGAGQ